MRKSVRRVPVLLGVLFGEALVGTALGVHRGDAWAAGSRHLANQIPEIKRRIPYPTRENVAVAPAMRKTVRKWS